MFPYILSAICHSHQNGSILSTFFFAHKNFDVSQDNRSLGNLKHIASPIQSCNIKMKINKSQQQLNNSRCKNSPSENFKPVLSQNLKILYSLCNKPTHCSCNPSWVSSLILNINYMKKLLNSDWLRAVQLKSNTSAKSVIPLVQKAHKHRPVQISK